MPEYYHNLITEKSFKTVQNLRKNFDFTLIGGWAVFLYAKSLKSKDIDIILDYKELGKFKKEFDVFKNQRLKKYEARKEEIDIDIYLPYFSEIGFPIEKITNSRISIEGFFVPIPEILLILKIFAYSQRKGTNKGGKDLIDIVGLVNQNKIDWKRYKNLINENKLKETTKELRELFSSTISVPEIGLFEHQTAKLKRRVLAELK